MGGALEPFTLILVWQSFKRGWEEREGGTVLALPLLPLISLARVKKRKPQVSGVGNFGDR